MPSPRLSGCSAYIVAAWPLLRVALLVADGEACVMREDGVLVAWVRVGRA